MYETVQIEYKHVNKNIYTYILYIENLYSIQQNRRYAGLLLSRLCPRE